MAKRKVGRRAQAGTEESVAQQGGDLLQPPRVAGDVDERTAPVAQAQQRHREGAAHASGRFPLRTRSGARWRSARWDGAHRREPRRARPGPGRVVVPEPLSRLPGRCGRRSGPRSRTVAYPRTPPRYSCACDSPHRTRSRLRAFPAANEERGQMAKRKGGATLSSVPACARRPTLRFAIWPRSSFAAGNARRCRPAPSRWRCWACATGAVRSSTSPATRGGWRRFGSRLCAPSHLALRHLAPLLVRSGKRPEA
jgi:hypothetical protein